MAQDLIDSWRRRLVREMRHQGLDKKNLSLKAGLGETYVRDTLERRGGRVENIAKLAAALGVTFKWLMLGEPPKYIDDVPKPEAKQKPWVAQTILANDDEPVIRVLGKVAAGSWRSTDKSDVQVSDLEPSPFPPERHYPAEDQFELEVRGTSINRFAKNGDRLRCVSAKSGRVDVASNDLVVVERKRFGGELVECSVKRLVKNPDGTAELWPDSTDPRWNEPIKLVDGRDANDDTIEVDITGVVLYAYDPSRRPARALA